MRLIELLEQGKKATREELWGHYIYKNDNDKIMLVFGDKKEQDELILTYEILTIDDWYEYKEELVNIKPSYNDELYCIRSIGGVYEKTFKDDSTDKEYLNNFNIFYNKEFATFIHKKQKLERAMMMYSYLNGANEIDWENTNIAKFRIMYEYDVENSLKSMYVTENCFYKKGNDVFFNTEEVAKQCLDLYRDEIEEVMNLSLKFNI